MSTIEVKLNVMLAERNVKLKDLAKAIDITEQNLSILKNGRAKGLRFETLAAICDFLDCEPGDIIRRKKE